jgi:type II secretory pathway pseudopilin PulG
MKAMPSEGGYSLIEALVATLLIAIALISLAQLFVLVARSGLESRHTTYAAVLASQKLEELRSLAWSFDGEGLPMSDLASDTADPSSAGPGTGLAPSPGNVLERNTAGWVDYVDRWGRKLGGGNAAARGTAYVRRWSVQPLPADPDNTLVIRVVVMPRGHARAADGPVRRQPEQARVVAVRTRLAR